MRWIPLSTNPLSHGRHHLVKECLNLAKVRVALAELKASVQVAVRYVLEGSLQRNERTGQSSGCEYREPSGYKQHDGHASDQKEPYMAA